MKFGIIKERKNPPDRRVVFSPQKLQEFQQQFPEATIVVESSDIRVFSDDAYAKAGFEIIEDLSDCDVLIGVKEVPIADLIPNKKIFFLQSYHQKNNPTTETCLKQCSRKTLHYMIMK